MAETKFSKELLVMRVAKENPKKPGSKSRARFDRYPTKATSVEQVLKIEGGPTRRDLDWDHERGFIAVGTAEQLSKLVSK